MLFDPKQENLPYTFALIKPDTTLKPNVVQEVVNKIEAAGLTIKNFVQVQELYREEVLNLFYKQQKYMDEIMTYMLSGECVMFLLCHETENPILVWKKMIGNKDPIEAKKADPQALRAIYGTSIIKNEFHGSDDPFSANKERDIFKFPIPQKIPDFKFDKMLVSLETLFKFLYPPNLEHSNALERLDIFAIYGPCVNYHSVDQCLCRECALIGKEHLEGVRESLITSEQTKLGIKIRPQPTTATKTQLPQRVQLPPIRLLKEEDIKQIYQSLCEKCQFHCNGYTHLQGGRNMQHIMTDQELNTLAKEMNKQEILELLYSEKGNAANVMIETIDLNEPNHYTKEMIELLFQELETDYYNRFKFYHLQNVILEDRRIRMNAWMSILINKPIHRFKNPKLVCKVPPEMRKNPESIHYTINRILPLNQTYKKKDITKMPLDFPPNLADKEKLNPNEEKLALLKKLHRDTHHMVEIQDAKKVVSNGVYLLRKYNDGRNGEWDNYSSLKAMNRGSYVNYEEKKKKEKL
ncbi:unnamed protein product [Paramecium octaurelia]|uniref:Nucleoside diphosphate kinase-like domain-containing protein n=1 Tax=Paramecium octaurelia TaxID=43137 RepID=A0A8S1VM96_PAROT|nr:unnamed protein product [Paramecium octaurelia]